MAETQVQHARGTSAQFGSYTGPAGEINVNIDDYSLRVQDGSTIGGWPLRTVASAGRSYNNSATSGSTITPTAHSGGIIFDLGGPLAALTINSPGSPNDGDDFEVVTTQPIAAVTFAGAGGATVKGGTFGLGPNSCIRFFYRAANTTWYRGLASGLLGFDQAQIMQNLGV